MKIQILGTGCARCDNLYTNAMEAAGRIDDSSSAFLVEKVGDPTEFVRLGVSMTPALVIDGQVVSSGKVLTPEEIEKALREHASGEGR